MWEIEWDDAATFSNGINAVCKDGKWAIVTVANWQGVETYPYVDVARNRYDYVMTAGRIVAADGQGYLLLDQDLNPVGEQHYDEIKAFESEQPTAFKKGEKWGFPCEGWNLCCWSRSMKMQNRLSMDMRR